MSSPRVAILVVGNEILSGDTREENAGFMARELSALGASLQRILIVPDDIDEIARSVAELSGAFEWVITCGGIGPTHDDVTLEGIAAAFGVTLVEHPVLIERIARWRGGELTDEFRRLARIPEGVELIDVDDGIPLVRLRNVFILPGVPRLLRRKFGPLRQLLAGRRIHQRQFRTEESELAMAARLRDLQTRYPGVAIGSYPETPRSGEWCVRLVLKSRDRDQLAEAAAALAREIDSTTAIDSETDPEAA